MLKKFTSYYPILPIAPGETLLEALQERNMTQADLARRMQRPLQVVNEIIKGKTAITAETVIQLEQVLSIPAGVWNNLESNYQDVKARIRDQEAMSKEIKISTSYPYIEMEKLNWVPATRDSIEMVGNLRSFFGAVSLKDVVKRELMGDLTLLYRKSEKRKVSPQSVAAWLRKGIVDCQGAPTEKFDAEKLRDAVPQIRALILEKPKAIQDGIQNILSKCGVAFTVTPSLKNTPINGVSRWAFSRKSHDTNEYTLPVMRYILVQVCSMR